MLLNILGMRLKNAVDLQHVAGVLERGAPGEHHQPLAGLLLDVRSDLGDLGDFSLLLHFLGEDGEPAKGEGLARGDRLWRVVDLRPCHRRDLANLLAGHQGVTDGLAHPDQPGQRGVLLHLDEVIDLLVDHLQELLDVLKDLLDRHLGHDGAEPRYRGGAEPSQ